jgi:aryl-alcohol dehydrogenase-like predicted oxidoreductase
MRRVKVPGSALEVSALVYGTSDWGSDPKVSVEPLYTTFREAGGTSFDTAHCYAFWRDALGASERALGACIRANDRRADVIVITKGGHPPDPPRYPRPDRYLGPDVLAGDVRDSLERLGTDYIDLYFLHRDDPRAPVSEVMDALAPEVASGRVRAIGASHWSVRRIEDANAYARARGLAPFVASQPGWSLAHPSPPASPYPREDRAWHEKTQLALFAFSPTARGYFARGNEKQFDNPTSLARLERAKKLGAELGATSSQVALAWLMYQPFPVVPILGTMSVEHLRDALGAARLTLTGEQVRWLEDG